MTTYDDMLAGLELDVCVAKLVMGQLDFSHQLVEWSEEIIIPDDPAVVKGVICLRCGVEIGEGPCARPYSTDIASAWEVVEKLGLEIGPWEFMWQATLYGTTPQEDIFAIGETAPLAICRAALKAVG